MAELPNDQLQLQGSRGYAVLITNEHFPEMEDGSHVGRTRKGAAVDDLNLQFIFDTKLKFQLLGKETYQDVSVVSKHPSWTHSGEPNNRAECPCISCKIQTTDHSQSECFVLAISTHGKKVDGEQDICFWDGLSVTLTEIIETLNDNNCKTLKGKPRIILLQACRSDPDVLEEKQWDMGHPINMKRTEQSNELPIEDMKITGEDESRINIPENEATNRTGNEKAKEIADTDPMPDSGKERKRKNSEDDYFYGEEKALHDLPSDFLIVFPTVSGNMAMHDLTHGSWLIDELRKVVEKHDFEKNPNMNFLSVLTSAAGRVARDKEGKKGQKTAVCIVHRLLRPIIFKDIEDTVIGQPNLLQDNPAF